MKLENKTNRNDYFPSRHGKEHFENLEVGFNPS